MGSAASLQVGILGLPGSGKSTFCYALEHSELFGNMEETSTELQRVSISHNESTFELFDIGGAYPREKTKELLYEMDAIFFLVDATADDSSMLSAAWELYFVSRLVGEYIPITILINNKKKPNALPFDKLFPLFTRSSLPLVNSGDEHGFKGFASPVTPHGFVVNPEKLVKSLSMYHKGSWLVAPLGDLNQERERTKFFEWISSSIAARDEAFANKQ